MGWCAYRALWLVPLLMGHAFAAESHQIVLLWPNGAPGSEGRLDQEKVRLTESGEHIVSNVHAPSITVYLPAHARNLPARANHLAVPARATGVAVVVVPGGGHTELWMDHEGYNVAEYLAGHGISAFVLKYRLAHDKGSTYTVEGNAVADLQRAIRLVKSRSAQWHVDPERVGVMGFSAGGELAALAATRYDSGAADGADEVERQSSRPSFQALIYPSIPAGLTFSPQTPPAFLLGGTLDRPAISQGLAELYLGLQRAGAHAELHLYEGVGHGFGLRHSNVGPVAAWPRRFLEWLGESGPLKQEGK
jgi:acetyl esterase/lipase